MAQPQLRCHTGIIRSSALVQAPSSLSMIRAQKKERKKERKTLEAWPRDTLIQTDMGVEEHKCP